MDVIAAWQSYLAYRFVRSWRAILRYLPRCAYDSPPAADDWLGYLKVYEPLVLN